MKRYFLGLFWLAIFFAINTRAEIRCGGKAVTPLRTLASKRNFLVGTAVNPTILKDWAEPNYARILAREYNMVSPENVMKFKPLHPEKNKYTFAPADQLIDFANQNQMALHAHVLLWHNQIPDWILQGNFSPAELKEIIRDHIQTVMKHVRSRFKGGKLYWDVVNEAIDLNSKRPDGMRETWWAKMAATPEEAIALAFQWAHEADPTAKLYYNDYSAEDLGKKSDVMFQMLSRLKKRGVPIDGVGLQSHWDEKWAPSLDAVQKNIERYADLGLEVQITEFDYGLANFKNVSTEQLAKQGNFYGDFLRRCLHEKNCVAFTTWGFSDAHSWIPDFSKQTKGAALPFDLNYEPKPAYCGLNQALNQ